MNFNKLIIFLLLITFVLTSVLGTYMGVAGKGVMILNKPINSWHTEIARLFVTLIIVHLFLKREALLSYIRKGKAK